MKLTHLTRGTAAALIALCAHTFLPAQAQAQEKSWDTIRIATEGAFPPFNLTKQDGTLDGYDVDLSNADLRGSDFTGANLTGANLTSANMLDAKLGEAKLARAKMTDSIGPTGRKYGAAPTPSAAKPWWKFWGK